MKRVYATITKRFPKQGQETDEWRGNLVVLDWDSQRVIGEHWIEFTDGPRKGEPSWCRGLAVDDHGRLCVAVSPGTIQYRDMDSMEVVDELAIESVDDIHEIQFHRGMLWVVNSFHNELVILRDREIVERRSVLTPDVQRYIYTWRRGTEDVDKIHFNSIEWAPGGRELHIYNSARLIYDVTNRQVAWLGHPLSGPHDLCFVAPGKVLTNSSRDNCTYLLDFSIPAYSLVYHAEKQAALRSPEFAAAGWTRGLAVHKNSAFIGVSPSEVVEVDFPTGEVRRQLAFSEDPREAPYAVLLDPRDWK